MRATVHAPGTHPLVRLRGIRKTFPKGSGDDLLVLDGINLDLDDREIVCLLGRSGSGKSTLLRIIAGLLPPTSGEVLFDGEPVRGPAPGIGMVFQTFALFPWLTVLENVEVGLEALGLPRAEMRQRAISAIDLIGLDGFESAYPKELSGGMRQRVGFARATAIHPRLLLMDEAFSALDVLTAENLRSEFLHLWGDGRLPIRCILMVTHNIEEAVLMGDRIVVLGTNPGRVTATIPITLPRPRDRFDPVVRELVDSVYGRMTARPLPPSRPSIPVVLAVAERLPDAPINRMAGFLATLAEPPFNGRADLPDIDVLFQPVPGGLLTLLETLHRFGLAELAEGDIRVTELGRQFVASDLDGRKALFRRQLITHVPLAAHIRSVLDTRPEQRAPLVRFREELEDHLSEQDAEMTLRTVIDWGRYAELFSYDDKAQVFGLDNPQ